jgi:hypothetical protein
MPASIQIFARDISDVEGHVFARYLGPGTAAPSDVDNESVLLRGTLRGPYCETAHTLPAEFRFRDLSPRQTGLAEAIVPDPCIWTDELPHLYRADIEARKGDRIVAEYHGMIGLRRSEVRSK